MFRKRTVSSELLHEEKAVYETINKLAAHSSKASQQQLRWAFNEDNTHFFSLFGKLAEIQWMHNEATRQMADKHTAVRKAFNYIFQEEKILEEARKDLQNNHNKIQKLQKQMESAKKKGDVGKCQTLEIDLTTQATLCEHLSSSVQSQAQKLELYKINQLKRGLRSQAEGVLTLAGHVQQLYSAKMQLIDLLPDNPLDSEREDSNEIKQQMSAVVEKISELLSLHPPINGGIDPKKLQSGVSPSSSPALNRRSLVDSLGIDLTSNKTGTTSTLPLSRKKPLLPAQAHKPEQYLYKAPEASSREVSPASSDQNLCDSNSSDHNRSEATSPLSISGIETTLISRPEVDYSQGMYCEIVIPDQEGDDRPTVLETTVRRALSAGGASRRKVSLERHLSLDQHLQAKISSSHLPLESDMSISSDDLRTTSSGHHYTEVNILPDPQPEMSVDISDYANPVDALKIKKKQKNETESKKESPDNDDMESSHYQTVEDIRKMREKQLKQRQGMCSVDDEAGYSRPFDALAGTCPLKVTSDSSIKKLNATPLAWKRTGSGDKRKERAAKSLHQTTRIVGEDQGRLSSTSPDTITTTTSPSAMSDGQPSVEDQKLNRHGSNSKRTWKLKKHANGTLTPPTLGDNSRTASPNDLPARAQNHAAEEPSSGPSRSFTNSMPSHFIMELEKTLTCGPQGLSSEMEGRRERTQSDASSSKFRVAMPAPAVIKKLRSGQARVVNPQCNDSSKQNKTGQH